MIFDNHKALVEWLRWGRFLNTFMKDAVTYAINQKEYLCAFLDHG